MTDDSEVMEMEDVEDIDNDIRVSISDTQPTLDVESQVQQFVDSLKAEDQSVQPSTQIQEFEEEGLNNDEPKHILLNRDISSSKGTLSAEFDSVPDFEAQSEDVEVNDMRQMIESQNSNFEGSDMDEEEESVDESSDDMEEEEENLGAEEQFEGELLETEASSDERPHSFGSTEAVIGEMEPPEDVAEEIQEIMEDVRDALPSVLPDITSHVGQTPDTPQTPVAAATKIQAVYRGHAQRRKLKSNPRSDFLLPNTHLEHLEEQPASIVAPEQSSDLQSEAFLITSQEAIQPDQLQELPQEPAQEQAESPQEETPMSQSQEFSQPSHDLSQEEVSQEESMESSSVFQEVVEEGGPEEDTPSPSASQEELQEEDIQVERKAVIEKAPTPRAVQPAQPQMSLPQKASSINSKPEAKSRIPKPSNTLPLSSNHKEKNSKSPQPQRKEQKEKTLKADAEKHSPKKIAPPKPKQNLQVKEKPPHEKKSPQPPRKEQKEKPKPIQKPKNTQVQAAVTASAIPPVHHQAEEPGLTAEGESPSEDEESNHNGVSMNMEDPVMVDAFVRSEQIKKLQADLRKKTQRISELKEKNKELVTQLQATKEAGSPKETSVDAVIMKDKLSEAKKKEKEFEMILKQKEEELDSLRKNYDKILKTLQSKKIDAETKQQNANWKSEIVKRNQEIQEKQTAIGELEQKILQLRQNQQKETQHYSSKLQKLEAHILFLRQELDILNKFIKDKGLSSPLASPVSINSASSKKLAPLQMQSFKKAPEPPAGIQSMPLKSPPRLEPLSPPNGVHPPHQAAPENPALAFRVDAKARFAPPRRVEENPALVRSEVRPKLPHIFKEL